jgi:hypothetical protein
LFVCLFGFFLCLRPVLCVQCCQSFWIVHWRLSLQFSLTFIYFGKIYLVTINFFTQPKVNF